MGKLIKICGLTTEKDIENVNILLPDFVGFVLFFEKSRRTISIEKAVRLREKLVRSIKSVAVVVSPTIDQIRQIENGGFDYIQIHGILDKKIYEQISLPILKAFHMEKTEDVKAYEEMKQWENIAGYIFDAENPGSGKPFAWTLLDKIDKDQKLWFLAGGINEDNVLEAMVKANPDGIDVSSAVEKESGQGKDFNKMKKMIRMVHNEK